MCRKIKTKFILIDRLIVSFVIKNNQKMWKVSSCLNLDVYTQTSKFGSSELELPYIRISLQGTRYDDKHKF